MKNFILIVLLTFLFVNLSAMAVSENKDSELVQTKEIVNEEKINLEQVNLYDYFYTVDNTSQLPIFKPLSANDFLKLDI